MVIGRSIALIFLLSLFSGCRPAPNVSDETKTRAEAGDAAAQCKLGVMYQTGEGVPEDFAEAAKWYRKAADQGNPSAQCNLGFLYSRGHGVPKNRAEAFNWYRKAAEQGDASGEFSLGLKYAEGEGVTRDRLEALAWVYLAIEGGEGNALETRASLEKYLGPEGTLKAHQRSGELSAEINRRKEVTPKKK